MKLNETSIAAILAFCVVVGGVYLYPDPQPLEEIKTTSKRRAEAFLLTYLPDDYLDTMNVQQEREGFSDTSKAAIWPPGTDDVTGGGTLPIWIGTIAELRALLEARAVAENTTAIPTGVSP